MWPRAFKILGVVGVAGAGLRYYCKGGVNTYKPDLEGKIVIVTGGNAGIGKETARELNRLKAKVIIIGRDEQKAKDFIDEVWQDSKYKGLNSNKIEFYKVDFSNLEEVAKFAKDFSKSYDRLDILINNAGLSPKSLKKSSQSQELTMAVNHLAPSYLTYLLTPILRKTHQSRVVNTASMAHAMNESFTGPLIPDFNDFFFDKVSQASYNPRLAYNQSKLANVLFTRGLAQYFVNHSVDAKTCSAHPGFVRTDFFRDLPNVFKVMMKVGYPVFWLVSKSEMEGAQTTLNCALIPYDKMINGGYYADCELAETSDVANDPKNTIRLWQLTNDRLKELTGDDSIYK